MHYENYEVCYKCKETSYLKTCLLPLLLIVAILIKVASSRSNTPIHTFLPLLDVVLEVSVCEAA